MKRAKHKRIEFAARALLARLDEIHADPRYQWVWQNSQIHGGPYTGPKYDAELKSLRRALAKPGTVDAVDPVREVVAG